MNNLFNNKGDTIVEVMIAIVVLGAALGAAMATSNSASQRTYNNHERYQAIQYANQQIDVIRLGTKDDSIDYSDASAGDGCFVLNASDEVEYVVGGCDSIDGVFNIKVQGSSHLGKDIFKVMVDWYAVGGADSNVELVYAID